MCFALHSTKSMTALYLPWKRALSFSQKEGGGASSRHISNPHAGLARAISNQMHASWGAGTGKQILPKPREKKSP